MKIATKEFGEIIVEDKDIVKFSRSIYGFDDYKNFVILNDTSEDDIMYLQSIENSDLRFVIVDPYIIMPNYDPKLTEDDINILDIAREHIAELKYMLIAVITENIANSVVNLKSPIVINPNNKCAIQAILQNQDYILKYPLFTKVGDANASN